MTLVSRLLQIPVLRIYIPLFPPFVENITSEENIKAHLSFLANTEMIRGEMIRKLI